MLHIIRNSAYSSNTLTQCIDMILPHDCIILMDDGCYNLSHTLLLNAVSKKQEITIYYISLHADARAQITNNNAFKPINLSEVVTLLFKHDNCVTWS